jgi:ankyrin repeat protein
MFDVGCWLLDVLRILQKRDNWILEISHIQTMKTTNLAALLLCIFALIPPGLRAQTNNLTALLQQGLFEEQANRNLDAAIADYQALARQFDKDRQLAATAVFRLGECYRMQGKTNEAALEYQRILRDFADEQTLATLSRQNLAGMGMSATPAVSSSLQTQKDLLAKQIALAEQDLADTQRLFQTGLVPQDKVRSAEREVLRLKQQLAALDSGRADLLDLSAPVKSEEDQEIAHIQTMVQNSPDLINAPVNGQTPLENAATHGWLKVAAYLLDHGVDVNARGGMALLAAAKAGNRAMVELLLSRGADANPKEYRGQIPLHVAVQNGFQAVVEVLLANKADVNAQNSSGVTPLVLAAGRDNPRIVSLLLEHKADVNLPDQSGATPLINAAHSGHPENVKLLLAAGANPNAETSTEGNGTGPMQGGFSGRTALSFAAENGSPEIVKMLLAAKADPNGGQLDAPLLCSIYENDIASAELLLQAGAKPNATGRIDLSRQGVFGGRVGGGGSGGGFSGGGSSSGRGGRGGFGGQSRLVTPLWLAISENQLPMVQLLLKFKADPNGSETDGRPLLFNALSDANILEALLDAGAKVDARDTVSSTSGSPGRNDQIWNWTPLVAAAYDDSAGAVRALLEHGANPNASDSYGATALHRAAANQRLVPALFEALLDHHANPNVRSNSGRTPLDTLKEKIAASGPTEQRTASQLADLLRQYGALDVLPDWDRITVSRPSANFAQAVFQKGTNDWNDFTLLETICGFDQNDNRHDNPLAFADLSHIVVVRRSTKDTTANRIELNLLNATNGVDCSKDMPLEFGDTVEIPEREHALAESPVYLPKDQFMAIFNYLRIKAGKAKLIVKGGETVSLPLQEFFSQIGNVLLDKPAQTVLTSSSDLAHVKVIRPGLKTGMTKQWILDCSHVSRTTANGLFDRNGGAPDLILRDGDVIEVPAR